MKKIFTIGLMLIVSMGFLGCEGDDAANSQGDALQIMFVYAFHANYYWNDETNEDVFVENTSVAGSAFGDPIPEFIHVKLGNRVFRGDQYSKIYPDSIFIHPGKIDYIEIQPLNGPFPEKGTAGNMKGEGRGFLYYEVEEFYYKSDDIVIGTGLYGNVPKILSRKKDESAIRKRIIKKLQNIIIKSPKIR